MTTTLEIFVTSYPDLFMPIWKYLYAPEQLDKALEKMEIIINGYDDRCKKRTQLIKYYLNSIMYDQSLVDIGIDRLMYYKISSEEFELIEQICLHNKYIPSIGCIMRHYLTSCNRGKLGIVELMFMFLQNNYINIIPDKHTQELAHWLLLQYGNNTTTYLNVKKFANMKSLTKAFNMKKYPNYLLHKLMKEHLDLLTVNFVDENIEHMYMDPINVSFDKTNKKIIQLIMPSLEQCIEYTHLDVNILPPDTTEINVLKQLLEYCKIDQSSEYGSNLNANHKLDKKKATHLKTIYNYLRFIIKDDIMMWLITGFALNMDGITKYNEIAKKFLLETLHEIEDTCAVLYENIEQLNKYIKFFRHILKYSDVTNRPGQICFQSDNDNLIALGKEHIVFSTICKICTFENTNILGRLCLICSSNRFD